MLVTALIVFSIEEYYHNVTKPVRVEQAPAGWQEWQDFIAANINAATTEEQCKINENLIALFHDRFINSVSRHEFDRTVERFRNMVDTKQKALEAEWALIGLTINSAGELKEDYKPL